jgi:hypothetical protein
VALAPLAFVVVLIDHLRGSASLTLSTFPYNERLASQRDMKSLISDHLSARGLEVSLPSGWKSALKSIFKAGFQVMKSVESLAINDAP